MKPGNPLASLLLAMTVSALPVAVPAQMLDADSAFTRIHLASKLSKNSQLVARLSCFIFAGVDVATHREQLSLAVEDFNRSRQALIDGDPDLGILAERSQRIRNAVSEVGDGWTELSRLVLAIADGQDISPGLMAEIDLYSDSLLERTNALNTRIANVYGEEVKTMPLILTLTLDMAGRQVTRMETASKEACLIGTGIDVASNSQELENTITLFNATLEALINGYPGLIMAAPTDEIRRDLDILKANWEGPKRALTGLYRGEDIQNADRQRLAGQLEEISRNLGVLIEEYESYHMSN